MSLVQTEAEIRARYASQFEAEQMSLAVWRADRIAAAEWLSSTVGRLARRERRHPAERDAMVAKIEADYVARLAKLEAEQEAQIQHELDVHRERSARSGRYAV